MQQLPDLQPGIPENAYDWSWTIIVLLSLLAGAIVLFIIYHKKGFILKGLRQTWQRFKAPMPTYFRNLFWGAVTIVLAPEFLEGVAAVASFLGFFPKWIKPEWVTQMQLIASGMIPICKLAISYRRTPPDKIPDLNHPAKPDAIIDVAEDGTMRVEVLNPTQP